MTIKRNLKPVLDGEWKLIGPSPDLKGIVPGAEQWKGNYNEHNAPVDHHIFRDPAGLWHLWVEGSRFLGCRLVGCRL